MPRETIHPRKWRLDPCPDARGHWTIRWDDGSVNGSTGEQPIAKVYDRRHAEQIVAAINAMSSQFAACGLHFPIKGESKE